MCYHFAFNSQISYPRMSNIETITENIVSLISTKIIHKKKSDMKKLFGILLSISLLLAGCNISDKNKDLSQEHLVLSTIWFQKSPEAKALFYQAFNIAKERVVEFSKEEGEKPKAVVVDLDETMIDNSPFQGKMVEEGKPYNPKFWAEWTKLSQAKATPGAKDFTLFCDSIGVEVIYLSNRLTTELEWTMRNLDSLGFAFVTPDNFLLVDETSAKEPRREKVAEQYDIILLLGDNLNDFAEVFQHRGDDWGVSVVEEYKNEFGRRFIIFPNPMYGDWEKSIYNNERGLNENEKFKLRRKAVTAF